MVDTEYGTKSAHSAADIIVASVPTLGRKGSKRIQKFSPRDFKLIIIDEAHHAAADSYKRTLNHFGALDDDSHILVWGCSATLARHDGMALDVFSTVSHHLDTLDLINAGQYVSAASSFGTA